MNIKVNNCKNDNTIFNNKNWVEYTDEIKKALEKQVSKKIIETPAFQSYYSAGDESETLCPNCENELEIENQTKYCCECGQKLDWSDFE